jgi:hypothetical protein
MLQNATKKAPKSPIEFYCNNCDFKCSKTRDYNRHILTLKHQNATLCYTNAIQNAPESPTNIFTCENCKKEFKHSSSMYRHKKSCSINNNNSYDEPNKNINDASDKDLIMLLIKENSELKKLMMEVIKTGTHNTTNNNNNTTHTNSHNKTFNLNVFLNETCKDAMNITDFVDSLKLQLSDLENVGKLGFVEGISNIIVKNLNSLDETKRPIHCTDSKREVMYIKDENKWEKEDDEKKRLRKAIKKVVNKNERLLFSFREKHPDCIEADSKYSDQYNKLIIEAMGGRGDNDAEKENKIIRNIAKEVVINKTQY